MSLIQKAMAKAKQQKGNGAATTTTAPPPASPVMRTKPVTAPVQKSPSPASSRSSSSVPRFKPIVSSATVVAPVPKISQPEAAPITPPRAPLSPSSAFATRQPSSSEEEEEEDSGEGEFSEEEEEEQPKTSTIRRVAEAAVAAVFPSPQRQQQQLRPVPPREPSTSSFSSSEEEEEVIAKRLPPKRQPPAYSSSEEEEEDEQEEYIVRRVKSRSGGTTSRRRRSRTPNPPATRVAEAIKLRQRSPLSQQQTAPHIPPPQAWSLDFKRRLLVGLLVFIVSFLVLDQQWNKQVTLPPTIQLQLGPSTTFEDLAESTLDKDELRGFELELKSKLQQDFESSLPVSHLYTAYQESRRTNTKMLLGAGLLAGFVIAGVFM